jgi:asparagine synthase (glutamine-hydrolysing)
MCGILGALDLRGRREFPRGRLQAMCQAIEHRGPDDEHVHLEPGVALGARRLSIVDLAGGRQPLSNETGSVWVAFNGELFEYPELFAQLQQRGHRFATRCDTELWVHLYEEHGQDVFQKVKGQFGVSLWDAERRTLFLARDRVGIAPLFYTEADGWLLWASEIKGLLASGLVTPRPDPKNFDHFFTCFFSSSPSRSFFDGIHCLPPGTFLRAEQGQIRLQRYWGLEFPDAGAERRTANPAALLDEYEHLLRQAVRRRLRGDVPVACYLSGGIDSTIVTALAAQESTSPPPAYTIGLLDSGKNEQAEAEQTCRLLGARFSPLPLTGRDMVAAYPELIRAGEAPVVDLTSAGILLLAKRVHADGFKVVLSGEGSDEAMGGYPWGHQAVAPPIRRWLTDALARCAIPRIRLRSATGAWERLPFRAFDGVRPPQQLIYEFFARRRLSLFSEETRRALWGHSPLEEFQPLPERYARWASLNQSLYIDYASFLHGHLLSTKGDRTAANASLEARPPFLDEDVVAFCAQLAPEYKRQGTTTKWLLRQVADRWLPAEITHRPKHGFRSRTSPFFGPDRPLWVDQLLSDAAIRQAGLFDPATIAACRTRQARASRWNRTLRSLNVTLTAVVAAQLWSHTFCGGGLADLPHWQSPIIPTDIVPRPHVLPGQLPESNRNGAVVGS